MTYALLNTQNAMISKESNMRSNSEKIYATAEKMTAQLFAQMLNELSKDQEAPGGFGEELMRPELNKTIAESIAKTAAGAEITESIAKRMIYIQEKSSPKELSKAESVIDGIDYVEQEYLKQEAFIHAVS